MKKTAILLAAMLLTSLTANSQNKVGAYSFKPYAGITLSKIAGNEYSGDFDPRIGLTVGFEGEYSVSHSFGITYGIAYSQKGAKDAFSRTIKSPYRITYSSGAVTEGISEIESSRDGTIRCDYVDIPVMAKLYICPGVAISAGVQIGILVDDKITGKAVYDNLISEGGFAFGPLYYNISSPYNSSVEVNYDDPASADYKIEYFAKQFDAGIPVGISLEYRNICLDARYYAGLFNILKGSYLGEAYNRSLSVTLAYRFGSR